MNPLWGGPGPGGDPGSGPDYGHKKTHSRGGSRGGSSKGSRGHPDNLNRKSGGRRPGGRSSGRGSGRHGADDDYTSAGGTQRSSQGQGALEPEEGDDGTSQSYESDSDLQYMETEEAPLLHNSESPRSAGPMEDCADTEGNEEGVVELTPPHPTRFVLTPLLRQGGGRTRYPPQECTRGSRPLPLPLPELILLANKRLWQRPLCWQSLERL